MTNYLDYWKTENEKIKSLLYLYRTLGGSISQVELHCAITRPVFSIIKKKSIIIKVGVGVRIFVAIIALGLRDRVFSLVVLNSQRGLFYIYMVLFSSTQACSREPVQCVDLESQTHAQ